MANHRHQWFEFGGLRENPGVYDTGNGALRYVQACRKCGARRECIEPYAVGRGEDTGWYLTRDETGNRIRR